MKAILDSVQASKRAGLRYKSRTRGVEIKLAKTDVPDRAVQQVAGMLRQMKRQGEDMKPEIVIEQFKQIGLPVSSVERALHSLSERGESMKKKR